MLTLSMRRVRRTNGATQTFRRPSVATTISSSNHTRDASSSEPPARYVPPHRNGAVVDTRYSKSQLIDLYKSQQESDTSQRDSLTSLYVAGWEPNTANGHSSSGWNRRDEVSREHAPGSEICWEQDGSVVPVGLSELTDEEKEVCLSKGQLLS